MNSITVRASDSAAEFYSTHVSVCYIGATKLFTILQCNAELSFFIKSL